MRRPRPHERSLALFALVCAAAQACASSGTFDGSVYRGKGVAFRLSPVPASWHPLSIPSADLAFRDEADASSILINSRCLGAESDAPLVALTSHLIIGTTDRHYALEETIPLDGREARHTLMRARLDGVPMNYDIFVLKKDGCVYDFVHVAPVDTAADAAAFDRFVHGFHTVSSAG